MDAAELWGHYQRLKSFRAVGKLYITPDRPNGVSHMAVKAALQKAGYKVNNRGAGGTGTGPTDKIYISPAQLNALMELARERGPDCSRHVVAREILDEVLRDRLDDYPDAYIRPASEPLANKILEELRNGG